MNTVHTTDDTACEDSEVSESGGVYRPSEAVTRLRPILRVEARPFVSMIKRAESISADPLPPAVAPAYRQFVQPDQKFRFSPCEPRRFFDSR